MKIVSAMVCMATVLCASAAQYWRGTTGNPVWDLTTANWASSASATTYSTYNNGTGSSCGETYFDTNGAVDMMVDEDGVEAYVINILSGTHTWAGGPVTALVLDPRGGNITIYNTVNLSTNGTYYGFRPRPGGSTITVGDGGVLTAQINPWSDSTLATKLVVLTNGTLRAMCLADAIKNNKFTLYYDGGNFVPLTNKDWQFVNSQFLLGAGGVHLQERTASDGCWSHLPGPIGTDETLPTDGGVWIDQHEGYMLLPNFTCTYRGGVHINSSKGKLGIRSERNLGAEPESPTNNIFFLKSGAAFVSHGGSSNIRLHPNRNLYLADGVVARLQTWSGNNQSLTIQGTIGCENVSNGVIEVYSYSGHSDGGVVAFCPTDNRTNHVGRLLVHDPTVIGSGTTLLESPIIPSGTSGIGDGAILNITEYGHLMVTGGVLRTTVPRHVCQNARLTISGGLVDLSASLNGYEILHGHMGRATTTIRSGGKLKVSTLRMAGDNGAYYTEASNSVVNVETGGVLSVTKTIYIPDNYNYGKKGTLAFNGGMLEWAHQTSGMYMENGDREKTTKGLVLKSMAGGMNVTNNNAFYIGVPVVSGAEHDGGVTKWGTGVFALMGKCTFNGPLTVMQGDFRLGGSNVLNSNITMRVNTGANFIMNTYSQRLARIEGCGSIWGTGAAGTATLTLTSAIAPGMGANSIGTLRVVEHALDIEDEVALEIDVDTDGNSDCLLYSVNSHDPLDLSKMTLKINDLTKLNSNKKYVIAKADGGIVNGALFKSTNLPATWGVRYAASSHEVQLFPIRGAKIIIR